MSNRNLGALLAVPLITVLVLSGCAQGNTTPTPSESTPPSTSAPLDPSASPEPEAPAPEPGVEVGAPISEEEAEALNDAEGQFRAYESSAGTHIVVDANAPLPAPVKADIAARAESSSMSNGGRTVPKPGAAQRLATSASNETGRTVIVIVHTIPDPQGIDWSGYAYLIQPWDKAYYSTQAEAEAAAVAYAAGKGVPASQVDTVIANY